MRGLEKKLHPMAQTDKETDRNTDIQTVGHGDFMTNSAELVKNSTDRFDFLKKVKNQIFKLNLNFQLGVVRLLCIIFFLYYCYYYYYYFYFIFLYGSVLVM